ncbi:ATP-dependent DNA helicase PIF1 [Fusarium oxysporum f. sp. conglutinans]|nr:ATP-dependent DNA helicase PIF1 [Fusarium oxysporum f. sp. conglutinans]
MDFGLNPEELSTDLLFVVCARCGEERPESAFRAKRQSAGQTKQCIDCRNQRVSHHSRSKVVLQTLRNIALRPSSPGRPATKRTEGDAGLSPPNERSGTQPTSPEKLRQLHTARSLFGESISQPHVVLGTPIPPTQQSSRLFRALAPSPPVQPTTHPLVSHSDPSTLRSSTPGVDYSYLATRFHKGGKDSQDDSLKAGARAKLAVIQRDHRSRRRAGEAVSLTPTISQLGFLEDFEGPGEDGSQDQLRPSGFLDGDGIIKEGDDRGQFSESDIDADDYFNLLLSPARPRRYLKRLGVESDSDLGDEDENDDNDCVDGSPLRHRLRQPSAQLRRGRRGPAPGTGGRPRKSRRQTRSSMPPRRIRSPVIIPPEESAVFHAQDPVWNGDLEACALTGRDKAILREFWTKLDNDQMQFCSRCQECWFQMKIDCDGICARCYRKDEKRRPDEPYFFSADNQLDFGPVPARLPQLTPTEESLIARVHVHVNIMLVRGQQYKYRGHVVHFLREVGLVYNQFPLLPQELNIVLLRPADTSSHAILSRQFTRQFRVRRQPVVIWLDYLRRHHPGYRCVVIDEERLNQLPQDGNVLDAIPQSQVEAADVGPEEDQEAEPDLEDEAAVPDLLAKDTELDALRSILAGESEADSELSTSFQAQAQHELQLPNIRHTPINEFNRSHALLSLAFPCLFPDGRADFVEPRLRSIDYKDYVEHAMRWHDGRFARHPTFRFVAFNTLMRSQARSRSRFFVKQHDGRQRQQPLTREQLIQALEHSEDPEAQALINSIARHAVSIRGTRPFWNKKRQDLEAYAYNLGCPGAFITFSPADLHWRSLYQHMPQYDDWLAATEPERMALSRRLLRQNPHIAAFHFYRRYTLFRDIVLSKKFSITDYWDRYEWQGRGSPHNHGLYWMDNCPGADMEDEAARDVFARTWGFHVTAINPEPSRTMPQGEGNPLSVDPLSIEMTFLRLSQIVNRCQRHKCNTTYCLRVRKRTGDLARDMEGAAADIEAANVANPERECRFDFPRALRELAAVIRKEGRSYYVFEAARNDSLMNNFNPAIILGWLANIDISPCTSLQAVITYAAKYCSKSEKKTESFARLADQVLPHTSHVQPLLSFSSRLMNKLIAERDYSAQEISHLLLNIPLQEGTRMVVTVDCRPLERQARSYRVDGDVNEAIGSYRKYLERKDQHEDITYLEYLQSYNLNTWRRLAAQAKKRVLSYFPRYKSMEASSQFNDFCRVKLMMVHPHRSPEELLVVGGQRFDSFTAAYMHCRQHHDTHADDHYGEPDTDELTAEEDEFELEIHEEPIAEEDWHELARMLPDRPLEEEDIDILGRRDIDINYDWTPHVGRYADDGILNSDYWKQRKAENTLDLDVDDQPLEARDSLNPEQRIVYDTVMGHFLTQDPSQLLLHVDGGGGTGKSYLINLLSAHLQSATGGRGTPVWRAAPTGVAGNQISGTTLHSLLHLPINKDFKPLSPVDKIQLLKKLKDIKYLIIDEKSMLGLRQLSWIDDRLREAFPNRNEEFFGGLNILLVGDFFQLPPVLQKPLCYDKEVQGVEIKGRNAYRRFDKSVFLKVVQRQRGDDQEAFRTALGELRLLQLSMESWKLLSTRVQAKLDDREVARFSSALRVYATKDRVNEYNHYHLDRLGRPVVQVKAKNVGPGAAAAPDDKAGNLAKQIPICIGARLMLTSNLWQPVGLCNGARGTVYDIGWAPGADPIQDPPCVIMMEFDKYNGPVFLTTPDGKKIVPILPVERDFLIGATLCARTQFPLIVCYAITVHKSQSITEDMIVTDLSCRDFQTGLSYVAVSRVKTLEGLMLDAPFDRNHLVYGSPPDGMKMKMRDQELRKRQVLTRSPYMIYNTKNGHGTGSARGPYEERGEKARDASYHEIWYCKHCDSTKKPNSVTTNLSRARKHLRDFHGIRVIEHVERSDLKKQQHGTITDLFGRQEERQASRDLTEEKYLANAINIPAFEEALARLLAVRNIAPTFIEYPEFHAVILSCNYMARDVLLRSRRAVPKLLKKTFAQHKQGLVKKLHNSLSSMVHFTIDMWTSSEQKAAYQAIVVHFVDAETRGVAQALLSLREFKGSHNGKLQAKAFLEVVEEYDLRGKVGYFTMDNHDANDTMLGDIAKEIDGLDPVARRLRCSGHIMNLIVQAFLFRSKAKKIQEDEREGIDEAYQRLCRLSEIEEGGIITKAQATEEWREFSVLGKLHNLCIYSRSSTSIYNDFKAEIGRALPRDNDTCWNSWFRLIDVAIEKRAKLMDWIQENHAKMEKDALDHKAWNELGDIHAFLQVFHQISVRPGRENTLDEVLSHMDFLHHHFTRTKDRAFSGPRFYARFHVAWLKFEKYYQLTEQAPVYVAGILLHPALRKSYLSEQWERNPAWVSNAVKAVRKIWSTEYKSYQLPDKQQEKRQELDEFDRWRQKVYSTASEVKDEFDRFIYGSQVGIGQQTALQWWLEPTQRENFPLLCRMAIDIFCIPPMSTEAERIFSGARRQVTWDRSSMSAKMVEACECIKSWISVPKGKSRPLLAGVFREAEDIDAAVRILQEDIEMSKGAESDGEPGELVV